MIQRTSLRIHIQESSDGIQLRLENDVIHGWSVTTSTCPDLESAIASLTASVLSSQVADKRTKQLFSREVGDDG